MRAGRLAPLVLVTVVLLLGAARAAEIPGGIGVVLLHGKDGSPDHVINFLASAIEAAGFPVERPTLCFSRQRIYDRAFLDCFTDIDAAVARVRSRDPHRHRRPKPWRRHGAGLWRTA